MKTQGEYSFGPCLRLRSAIYHRWRDDILIISHEVLLVVENTCRTMQSTASKPVNQEINQETNQTKKSTKKPANQPTN